MNYLKQIQNGIDFIEANLDDEITFAEIAKQAGLSQWHFQRIFKALTNETLKTYIRSRRLANSLDKLLTSKCAIIDIALTAGYESQESFTRAFKSAFDLTPNEYRKIGDKNLFLKKLEFDVEYIQHINRNISLVPEIYTQNSLQLVGLRTSFYGVDSEKNNVAEKLPQLWGEFVARIHEVEHVIKGTCYGVVRQIKDDTDQLQYFAAIEVQHVGTLPEGMCTIEIPSSIYARFAHRGEVKSIDNTVNFIYSSWLLGSGKRHSSGADLEFYGEEYNPVSPHSLMHYAIPIK